MTVGVTEPRPAVAFEWKRVLGVTVLAILIGYAALIVFFIAIDVIVYGRNPPHHLTRNAGSAVAELLRGSLELPVGLVVLFFLPRLARVPLSSLGYRGLRRGDIVPIVVAFAAGIGGNIGYGAFLKAIHQSGHTRAGFELVSFVTPTDVLTFFVVIFFVAPFAEETLFRALLFNAFAKWTPVWVAAAASAALSAAISGDVRYAGLLAYYGLLYAVIYRRTGNIYTSMILHALNNAFYFMGLLNHAKAGA